MEKFENLTNKELHAKIVEYGLPNIPVTDSNRNVLIKRIIKTLEEDKKTKRRQTVAAAPVSSTRSATGNIKLNYEISVPESPPQSSNKARAGKKTAVVAISEELLALSNKDIQKLCREYGLENIPVTDSNRNTISRRLQTAMDEFNKNKSTTRRHTIQPMVSSSSKETLTESRAIDKGHQSRNNIRRTVTSAIDASPSPSPRRQNTVYEQVDSSSSFRNQYIAPVAREEKRNFLPPLYSEDASRRERSVSLSKTGVLTTSYMQESSPSLIEHMEVDEAEDENNADYEFNTSYASKSYSPSYAAADYNRQSPYNTYVKPGNVSTTPTAYSTNYSTVNYDASKAFNDFAKPRDVKASPTYSQKPSVSASLSSSTTRYTNLYPKLDTISNDNLTKRNYQSLGASPASSSSFASQYLSNSGYQSSKHATRTSYASANDEELYNDLPEAEEFSSDDQFEHEPEPTFLNKYSPASKVNRRSTGSYGSASPGFYEGPKKRRSTVLTKSGSYEEESPFKQFIVAMDRKYHIRQALIMMSIFVLAVFIYVFFIQP